VKFFLGGVFHSFSIVIFFILFILTTLCLHFIYKDEEQLKVEVGKVLVYEKDIKDKWKKYFQKLFNDGYEILLDSKILIGERGSKLELVSSN